MTPLAMMILLVPQESRPVDLAPVMAEMRALREQVALLEIALRQREAALGEMQTQLRALGSDLAEVKDRTTAPPPSSAFMGGPPLASDAVGVAKAVVFAPRLEGDNVRRRDLVKVRVRRVEPGGFRPVGEVELGQDGTVDLPIDQNGALYVADWSTGEGQTFTLVLRDGASLQEAASCKVRPELAQGHFFFVGYRLQ
ncbi:MAG TPA: hypothetical protein VFQ51_02440 [Vicinamibacteria bacterium]|nr:hypothetical protein [Vicinamibacteria bacterium]